MPGSFKQVVKDFTPPILLRSARRLLASGGRGLGLHESEGAKGPDWYDESFERSGHWRLHYSESHYYFVWTVIADRVMRSGAGSILEIGCGAGQLACLMRDRGISAYHGFDFSPKRIDQARRVCPEFTFSVQDATTTDLFTTVRYDTVLCTEFLEHVEADLAVLSRIRPGTRFLGTVPNFPFTSHVRHFADAEAVRDRYGRRLGDLRVDAFLASPDGRTFFLLDGRTA